MDRERLTDAYQKLRVEVSVSSHLLVARGLTYWDTIRIMVEDAIVVKAEEVVAVAAMVLIDTIAETTGTGIVTVIAETNPGSDPLAGMIEAPHVGTIEGLPTGITGTEDLPAGTAMIDD